MREREREIAVRGSTRLRLSIAAKPQNLRRILLPGGYPANGTALADTLASGAQAGKQARNGRKPKHLHFWVGDPIRLHTIQ